MKFIATNENILESISGDASMHLFIIDVQLYHISDACPWLFHGGGVLLSPK